MLQQNWKQKEQFWYILDAVSITVDKKKISKLWYITLIKIISQHCVLTIYKEIRYVFFETLQYFIFFNFKLNNVGNVFPDQGATGSDYPCNVSIAPTCTPVKKQLIPGPKVINKLLELFRETDKLLFGCLPN